MSVDTTAVAVPAGKHTLRGILALPSSAIGIVLFAHSRAIGMLPAGCGSGRFSPRNQFVARILQEGGLATLLLDLLDEEEAEHQENIFDVALLADRLLAATRWLYDQPLTRKLGLGYFGANTGAAAAFVAAARQPGCTKALVSRGGRPDLASNHLPLVKAPVLLMVGSKDEAVLQLNEQALTQLYCVKELMVIPNATHFFPEPCALEAVAGLASVWFERHLKPVN